MFDKELREYYKKRLQVVRFGEGGFADEFDSETEAIIYDMVKASIHNVPVDKQVKAFTAEDAIKYMFELKYEIEREKLISEREHSELLGVKLRDKYTKFIKIIKKKYNKEIEETFPEDSIMI